MLLSYTVILNTDANKLVMNRILAYIFGDMQPPASENISRPLIPSDTVDPSFETEATHWYGGLPLSSELWAIIVPADADLPTPPGGWPLMDEEDNELLDETTAQGVWAARKCSTMTDDAELGDLAMRVKSALFADLGLMPRPDEPL